MQSDNVVLVCGLARSGTTWVAKILDSHPDTRYVHEPDDLLEFRQYLQRTAASGRAANIRELVAALNSLKRINQSGSWPVCRKRHEGELGYRARQANALALRLASRRLGNLRMRSLTSANDYALSTVWKSVNQLHALPGLMDTWPEMKVMLLLRHPAAVIASRKRGVALGKMAPLPLSYLRQVLNEGAAMYPQAAQKVDMDSSLDLEAFRWAYLCSRGVDVCEQKERAKILRYEDLVVDAEQIMLAVMPWMGLDWDVAQQQFVKASAATVSGGFYSLKRAQSDLDKWRIDMPPSSVERVMSIVRGTPAGLFYN